MNCHFLKKALNNNMYLKIGANVIRKMVTFQIGAVPLKQPIHQIKLKQNNKNTGINIILKYWSNDTDNSHLYF